jgi:hypothetical protein
MGRKLGLLIPILVESWVSLVTAQNTSLRVQCLVHDQLWFVVCLKSSLIETDVQIGGLNPPAEAAA